LVSYLFKNLTFLTISALKAAIQEACNTNPELTVEKIEIQQQGT